MKITHIALDLDGTLLNSRNAIEEKTKEALLQLEKEGITLILASVRPFNSMLSFSKELELELFSGYLLSSNGARGFLASSNEELFSITMDEDDLLEVYKYFKDKPLTPMILTSDAVYIEEGSQGIIRTKDGKTLDVIHYESSKNGLKVHEVKHLPSLFSSGVTNLLYVVEPRYLEEHLEGFMDAFSERVSVTSQAPFYLEFMAKGVNKAEGLKKLGIDSTTLLSFGDALNDKEMLAYSRFAVAMKDSPKALCDEADLVTVSNNSEGIFKALQKLELL